MTKWFHFKDGVAVSTSSASSSSGQPSSSKRLSPVEKLIETLLCFDKSLDMLLVDIMKEDATDTTQDKKENENNCEAGTSKS